MNFMIYFFRWIMYIEHSICKCDSKLLVFHESLKKMKRRLEALEQVFEAPRMYVLAVLEILRRRSFSIQFLEWGRNVSLSSSEARSEEIEKRRKFSEVFGNHFLHSLFSGLDDIPTSFADSPPRIFDDMLPDINVDDIRALQNEVPELLVELSWSDSMEQSFYAKEKLSQSNLSRLCDPKSNPKLVETLRLRELTGTNGIPKMTVSQLQKEISQEDIAFDFTKNQMNWHLGESAMTIGGGDFEPSSLKTLTSELEGLQSSQSSEVSDSMFRSAEGLQDQEINVDSPGEMVGVLDLSEEPNLSSQEGGMTPEVSLVTPTGNLREEMASFSKSAVDNEDISRTELQGKIEEGQRMSSKHALVIVSSPMKVQIISNSLQIVKHVRLNFMELKKEVGSFFIDFHNFVSQMTGNISDVFELLSSKIVQTSQSNNDLKALLESERKLQLESHNKMSMDHERERKAVEEMFTKEINQLKTRLKLDFEIRRKGETEPWQGSISELSEKYEADKSNLIAELNSKLKISYQEIEKLNESNDLLNLKIAAVQREMEIKEKKYQEDVREIEYEKEHTEKLNIKMKEETESLRSSKKQLELENQKNFNSALNQVKKEKEKTIAELQIIIDDLKSEAGAKKRMTEEILAENGHYKAVNSKIMNRIEALENDKEKLITSCSELRNELSNLQNDLETEKMSHISDLNKLEEMKGKMEEEKMKLIEKFEMEKSNLKEESSLQVVKLIEDFKKQRTALKEEIEKEKAEMKENLEKEKAALALSFEAEKQKFADEFEKHQSLSKTSSIEEGIDALEWDRVLQNLRDLETENKHLKTERDCQESLQIEVKELRKICAEVRKENRSLIEKLNESQILLQGATSNQHLQKISFRQFKTNDVVLLCYDEQRSNYMVLTSEDTKYFLHPESKPALHLLEENPEDIREWVLAVITDQEYCVAKKTQNRFKLPVGTYFYRIRAIPWT